MVFMRSVEAVCQHSSYYKKRTFICGIVHYYFNRDYGIICPNVNHKNNTMKHSEEIYQFISERMDWSTKDLIVAIQKEFGETYTTGGIRTRKYRVRKEGVPQGEPKSGVDKTPEQQIEEDYQIKKLKDNKVQTDKKYKMLLDENEKLRELVSVKNETIPFERVQIVADKQIKKAHATAFVLASDWHLEQEVDPTKINEPNAYSLEIAKKRAQQFFRATLILLREAEQNVHIKDLVLWLGGDFITGNIHTENLKICKLGPSPAICFARDLLVSGIEFLLENTDLNIIIPFNHGNHARITDKVWKSSEEDNSLEYILYDDIAFYFRNNKRITMVPPRGAIANIEVYGLKIAFVHGHHGFRYSDGVGGLYIPARKYMMRKFPSHYLVCMGHYHQYLQDTKFICNGSMIGYDQYADSMGFPFEIPKQTFFLIEEKRRCRTVTRPILFDD
jgi:hypothetical protein